MEAISIDKSDLDIIDDYRRKFNTSVLTILFTDIESSTKLREQLGDKGYTELLEKHDSVLLPLIAEYDGLHIKSIGDSVLAVFYQPSDAVECAVSMQDAIYNLPLTKPFLKVRIGIDMGQIAKEQSEGVIKDIFGRFVNRAARIEGLADGGHILCSDSVQDNATGWIDSSKIRWHDHGFCHIRGVEKHLKIWEPFNANITVPEKISQKHFDTDIGSKQTERQSYDLTGDWIIAEEYWHGRKKRAAKKRTGIVYILQQGSQLKGYMTFTYNSGEQVVRESVSGFISGGNIFLSGKKAKFIKGRGTDDYFLDRWTGILADQDTVSGTLTDEAGMNGIFDMRRVSPEELNNYLLKKIDGEN